MGKITFRADDDLVDSIEAFEASKSEVMRDALRLYLDEAESVGRRARDRNVTHSSHDRTGRLPARPTSIDDVVTARVDELLDRRLGAWRQRREPQDVNVTIQLEGLEGVVEADATADVGRRRVDRRPVRREPVGHGSGPSDPSDVHAEENDRALEEASSERCCSQCGEGLAADHVYCPNCGEKASRRLFCECGDEVRSDWSFCPGCGRRTPAADVLESGST